MRVAVVGAGAVGGYLGGRLARAGVDVTFVARGTHLEALVERGLTVHSVHGDFGLSVRATDDPASVGVVDLVLYLVKTYDTDQAVEQTRALVGDETVLLSLQNGIDNAERIRRITGRGHALGGLAYIEAALEAPGVVAQYSLLHRIVVGELTGAHSTRADQVAALFRDAGLHAEVSATIERDLWAKWIFICATSGLTTMCRQPMGPVLATRPTRGLFEDAAREVASVGRARGVALLPDAAEIALRTAESVSPAMKSSMLRDAERGAPLEIDALNGRVVELGISTRTPTPVNGVIYAALLPSHLAAMARRTPADVTGVA